MSEWKKVKLGEVCKRVTSGGTPKANVSSYYNPPTIPWLKTKEVNYCRITKTENYISEEGLNNSSAKLIAPNSVIIAMYGQGDTAGRVAINKIPLTTNQACCNLTIDETIANYEYVYYQLSTLYSKMVSLKAGAAQPNLNAQIIKNLEISLPPLNVQINIATVLSRYDTLIENYQRQIELLEEAAQRLYKEWFVDLHNPDYENTRIIDGVPEGWEKKNVNSILTFNRGYDLTHKEFVSGPYPVVGSTSIIGNHNKYKIEGPGIVTGRSGSLGVYQLIWDNFWPHNTSLYISDFKGHDVFYIYCLLKTVDFTTLNSGGAIPSLNRNTLSNISVMEPPMSLQAKFSEKVMPMFKRQRYLQSQVRLLTEARDRLLPKLISGEISGETAQSVTSGLGVRKEQTWQSAGNGLIETKQRTITNNEYGKGL